MPPAFVHCPETEGRTNLLSLPEEVWCFMLDSSHPDIVAAYGDCEDYFATSDDEPGAVKMCYLDGTR